METIGCQMNVCDSDAISETLISRGWVKVGSLQDADVAVLNTCSVRAQAEQKAFSWLGRASEFKEKNPGLKIAVVGCMAERIAAKIKKRFKKVDLIVGAKEINSAAEKISALAGSKAHSAKISSSAPSSDISYVTIMRGCDNFCSYCVVPFVRGHEISLDCKDIVESCRKASGNGAKEIMLLGQNVNSYKYGDMTFAGLLKEIAKIESVEAITFMTSHPKDLSDELIDEMAAEPKIKKYIHLPLQSGSDKILEAMNRKYSYGHYKSLIEKLRSKIPDINITTDIIVGFPGETEEDFNETLRAVKDIKFNAMYVFKYSTRPNTKAAEIKDDVTLHEKKRRHSLILEEAKLNK